MHEIWATSLLTDVLRPLPLCPSRSPRPPPTQTKHTRAKAASHASRSREGARWQRANLGRRTERRRLSSRTDQQTRLLGAPLWPVFLVRTADLGESALRRFLQTNPAAPDFCLRILYAPSFEIRILQRPCKACESYSAHERCANPTAPTLRLRIPQPPKRILLPPRAV